MAVFHRDARRGHDRVFAVFPLVGVGTRGDQRKQATRSDE
jgi:hypothetical protein